MQTGNNPFEMRRFWLTFPPVLFGLLAASVPASASLIGTEFSLEVIFQLSPSAAVQRIGILSTATVSESEVEFPNVADLDTKQPGVILLNVSIDVGADRVDIDFDKVGTGAFARAYENTYIFRFDSEIAVEITGATIDTSVTTLDLAPEDVTFSGNELHINVDGLAYTPSTFARIRLTSEGGPEAVEPEAVEPEAAEPEIKPKRIPW